jgi:hypothetical protein
MERNGGSGCEPYFIIDQMQGTTGELGDFKHHASGGGRRIRFLTWPPDCITQAVGIAMLGSRSLY